MCLDELLHTATHKHNNILVTCREAENMFVKDPSHTTTSHISSSMLSCVCMSVFFTTFVLTIACRVGVCDGAWGRVLPLAHMSVCCEKHLVTKKKTLAKLYRSLCFLELRTVITVHLCSLKSSFFL